MAPADPLPLPDALELLRSTLEQSPADATEIAWSEVIRQSASTARDPGVDAAGTGPPRPHCTVQVRVVERGRHGQYTTGYLDAEALRFAVRQALAQAAVGAAVSSGGRPLEPPDDTLEPATPPPPQEALFDPAIAHLTAEAAVAPLRQELEANREVATLDWTLGRVAVLNSQGLERHTAITCAQLRIDRGEGPGAGHAAAAARTLPALDPPALLETARRRAAEEVRDHDGSLGDFPALHLAPEAAADLLLHLRRLLRAHCAFRGEGAPALPKLESRTLDPRLHLMDDPRAEGGLPFPFDLRGAPLPVRTLLKDGALEEPFPPTCPGPGDERGSHLRLDAGSAPESRLWELCDGGLTVTRIPKVDVRDAETLHLRCTLQGVRRLRDGKPAEALTLRTLDLPLLTALESLLGLGDHTVTLAEGDGLYGGVRAPGVGLRLDARPSS